MLADPFLGLLQPGETVPEAVKQCADFLRELGIWHKFSRNDPVSSCQDAAHRRTRLGHKGYHLRDELKTFCGRFLEFGNYRYFLAHCRGDRELDFERVRKALFIDSNIERVAAEDLAAQFNTAYGTVNPFVREQVIQVFDNELNQILGVPGTVMTNAGERTWAVEFYVREFVRRNHNCSWKKLCLPKKPNAPNEWGVRKPKTIGILTGNPGRSGSDLHNAIDAHAQRLLGKNSAGDISMPRVVICSEPEIGISMELDLREQPLWDAIRNHTERLLHYSRAGILAHPAHTTSYFAPQLAELAAKHRAEFISLPEATLAKVRKLGLTEIALLGTEYVVGQGTFSAYRGAFDGITIHTPSQEGLNKVQRLGYEVQQSGPNAICHNLLRDLLQREVPASCQHVLLLMTEFTPVLQGLSQKAHQGKTLIDPIDAYGEAIARAWFEG